MTKSLLELLERRVEHPDAATQATIDAWRSRLADIARASGLPQALLEPVLDAVAPLYAATDRMAMQQQRKLRCMDGAVAVASVVGVAASVLDRVVTLTAPIPTLIGGTSALVGLVFVLVSRRRVQQRWVQARFCSEIFRIAPFTMLAGVDLSEVERVAIDSLVASPNPSPLLRSFLRQHLPPPAAPALDHPCLAAFVRTAWFDDQQKYHAGNRRQKRGGVALARLVAALAFAATTVAAVVTVAANLTHTDLPDRAVGRLAFASTVLPAVAANVLFLITAREFARVSARSGRMAREFAALARRTPDGATPDAMQALVREAAEMAALESYEWSVLLGSARGL